MNIEDFYYQCETVAREFSASTASPFDAVSAFMRGAEWAYEKLSTPDLLAENERLRNIILSPLDADAHPWQWVAALLSEYNELRQKSGVPPVDFDADATMTGKVGALLTACEKYMNNWCFDDCATV